MFLDDIAKWGHNNKMAFWSSVIVGGIVTVLLALIPLVFGLIIITILVILLLIITKKMAKLEKEGMHGGYQSSTIVYPSGQHRTVQGQRNKMLNMQSRYTPEAYQSLNGHARIAV